VGAGRRHRRINIAVLAEWVYRHPLYLIQARARRKNATDAERREASREATV